MAIPRVDNAPNGDQLSYAVRPEPTLPHDELANFVKGEADKTVKALEAINSDHSGIEHARLRASLLNRVLGGLGMHDTVDDLTFTPLLLKAEENAESKVVTRVSDELGDDHPLMMILEHTYMHSTGRARLDAQLMMRGALMLISKSSDS